jgi:hypothetical protein
VTGYVEHGSESSGSIEAEEIFDQLSDYLTFQEVPR